MSLFKEVSRISISTAVFMVLTIVLGYAATLMGDTTAQVEVMMMAVVFLVLFFYSLLKDKIAQLESGKNAPAG